MAMISLFAALMLAGVNTPQVPSDEERDRVRALAEVNPDWHHLPAWMGFRWVSSFGEYAGGVWIYSAPTTKGAPAGRPTRPRYVAQKISMRAGEAARSEWTNTDQCPALMEIVRSYERLEPPRVVVMGLDWPPTVPKVALDGTSWTIWVRQGHQADDFLADVTMTSNAGTIERWGREAKDDLEPCWTSDEPAENF